MKGKINFKYIKTSAMNVIRREKKRLIKLGCVILAVITVAGGILILFKNREPELPTKQPAQIIEVKDEEENRTQIFLEKVEKLETDLYQISSYVFSEKNIRIDETVGESSKDYVTVRGNFRVKYSIDMSQKQVRYDFENEKVIVDVPQRAIGVDSIELIGDIIEVDRYDSWFEKVKDIFNNNEEEMKDLAIKRLFDNSRTAADEQNKTELYKLAKEALGNELDDYDLNIEINIVADKTISVKNR